MAKITITKSGVTGTNTFTLASDGTLQISVLATSDISRGDGASLDVDVGGSVYEPMGEFFTYSGTSLIELKAGTYRISGYNVAQNKTTLKSNNTTLQIEYKQS